MENGSGRFACIGKAVLTFAERISYHTKEQHSIMH
jgi:hypothetical protein